MGFLGSEGHLRAVNPASHPVNKFPLTNLLGRNHLDLNTHSYIQPAHGGTVFTWTVLID